MLDFFKQEHSDFTLWIASAAVFLSIFLIGFLFRKYVAVFIQKVLEKLGLSISDETVITSKQYISFWAFLIGLYCAFLAAPVNHKEPFILRAFFIVFAFSVVVLIADVLARAFKKAVSETIGVNIIKFIVITVGVLLILNQAGIKLTPILTALGIGSLAVALALQDTLGNFFAGMNIFLGKLIMRGDYIRLDSGQEGTVVEIGWRATKIRELSNIIIVVPNIKITSAIISKYNYRKAQVTATVNCGVAYGSDLEKVERTALSAVSEVLLNDDGAVKDFKPICRFSQFADSSINFVLIFRVKDVFSRGYLTHAVFKNLKKRFDEEGIEIPFPQRVVKILENEKKVAINSDNLLK